MKRNYLNLEGLSKFLEKLKSIFALKTEVVSGVKGRAESAYRTGKVSLSPGNIGAVDAGGDTMTGELVTGGGTSVVTLTSGGVAGYKYAADIKVLNAYANVPVEFVIAKRDNVTATRFHLAFKSTESQDPGVASFTYEGSDCGAYLVKTAASAWGLYIQQMAWQDMKVYAYHNPYSNKISVVWHNHNVTEKPTGLATVKAEMGGNVRNALEATKATSVVDYNDAASAIQIGFKGASLTANEATYAACFTSNGKIKDTSFDVVKAKMGLNDVLTKNGGTLTEDASIHMFASGPINNEISLSSNGGDYRTVIRPGEIRSRKADLSDDIDREVVISNGRVSVSDNYENSSSDMEFDGITHFEKGCGLSYSICQRYDRSSSWFTAAGICLYNGTIPQVHPYNDAKTTLGASNKRWNAVYSSSGAIQTSDRTKKDNIATLPGKLAKNFIMSLIPSSYTMKDGTSGRTHYGLIAQDVEDAMKALDMESTDFAGFIKSPRTAPDIIDEKTGKVKHSNEVLEGEFDYSLRYDEFIAPLIKMVQMQQQEIDELKVKLENQG